MKQAKLLGVYIDNTLSWDAHINFISKKILGKLVVLRRVSNFMPPNALILKVFNSIVFLHFTYFCTVWCNVNNQLYLDKLFKLQKKAARILLNIRDILTPTSFLFSCLSWMPTKDYFMFRQVIFLYKVLHNQMPDYLSVFQYTRDVNCHQTRSNDCMSNLLYLPRPKTENYRRS